MAGLGFWVGGWIFGPKLFAGLKQVRDLSDHTEGREPLRELDQQVVKLNGTFQFIFQKNLLKVLVCFCQSPRKPLDFKAM